MAEDVPKNYDTKIGEYSYQFLYQNSPYKGVDKNNKKVWIFHIPCMPYLEGDSDTPMVYYETLFREYFEEYVLIQEFFPLVKIIDMIEVKDPNSPNKFSIFIVTKPIQGKLYFRGTEQSQTYRGFEQTPEIFKNIVTTIKGLHNMNFILKYISDKSIYVNKTFPVFAFGPPIIDPLFKLGIYNSAHKSSDIYALGY